MLKPSEKGENLNSRENRNSNLEKLDALNSRIPEELADAYCRLDQADEMKMAAERKEGVVDGMICRSGLGNGVGLGR